MVQEKKLNVDFQAGGNLGFSIRMILATVGLQVTWILQMKFESIALLVQEKKFKIDFHNMTVRVTIVCVEVLRPSQPNWVMSSVVSLPNHMFTGQT